MRDPLPTEQERKALSELIHFAFTDLRSLTIDEDTERAHDLAYAFHNLPVEMYGWGTWNVSDIRQRFRHYQQKYYGAGQLDGPRLRGIVQSYIPRACVARFRCLIQVPAKRYEPSICS